MTTQQETKEPGSIRKKYAPNGQRGQRPFNFRMDLENYEWISQKPNRGRYLNKLIEEDRIANQASQ